MPSGFGILGLTGNQTFHVFWGPENLSFPVLLVTLSWLWATVTMEYCFLRPGCKSLFTRSYCEGGKQRHCVISGNNDPNRLPHYLQMERELFCSVCFDLVKAWLVRKTTNMKWLQLQCEGGYLLNAQLLPMPSSCSVLCQQGRLQDDQAPMQQELRGNAAAFCVCHRDSTSYQWSTHTDKRQQQPQAWSNTCWIYAVHETSVFFNSVSLGWILVHLL